MSIVGCRINQSFTDFQLLPSSLSNAHKEHKQICIKCKDAQIRITLFFPLTLLAKMNTKNACPSEDIIFDSFYRLFPLVNLILVLTSPHRPRIWCLLLLNYHSTWRRISINRNVSLRSISQAWPKKGNQQEIVLRNIYT